jgi:hypothetical protein
VPGASYSLSLDLFRYRNYNRPAMNQFQILFNGVVIFDQSNTTPFGWETLSFQNLVATGELTTLEFRGRASYIWSNAIYLDNIVVDGPAGAAVPETGNSAVLAGMALLALSVTGRLSRRTVAIATTA